MKLELTKTNIDREKESIMQLVSAIITTRNRSQLLRKAIESVLSQTYKELECVVVDDSSTDDTRQVCSEYPVRYIYIPKEESRGGNYARNLGVKASKGEYVAFLDDDDYWLSAKIEKQLALLEDKKCEMVYCMRRYQNIENGQVVKEWEEPRPKPQGDLRDEIFRHYITNTSCILATKSLIEQIGGFDENLRKWQEYDLMIRAAQVSEIYYVNENLCVYRNDNEDKNRISNDFNRITDTVKKISQKYWGRIRILPLRTKFYFMGMCIEDSYILAMKTNHLFYRCLLFLPHRLYRKLAEYPWGSKS